MAPPVRCTGARLLCPRSLLSPFPMALPPPGFVVCRATRSRRSARHRSSQGTGRDKGRTGAPARLGGPEQRPTVRRASSCGDAGGDVEADLALDAERLEGEGAVGAADQDVGAEAETDRGFRRDAAVGAGERADREALDARRSTAQTITVRAGDADVEAELADAAGVVLRRRGRPARRCRTAVFDEVMIRPMPALDRRRSGPRP